MIAIGNARAGARAFFDGETDHFPLGKARRKVWLLSSKACVVVSRANMEKRLVLCAAGAVDLLLYSIKSRKLAPAGRGKNRKKKKRQK